MSKVYTCRISQDRVLRSFVLDKLGVDEVSLMSDSDIKEWLEGEGYQSYIEYCGEYDDSDDILIAKSEDINELVNCGRAFWATRSGKCER